MNKIKNLWHSVQIFPINGVFNYVKKFLQIISNFIGIFLWMAILVVCMGIILLLSFLLFSLIVAIIDHFFFFEFIDKFNKFRFRVAIFWILTDGFWHYELISNVWMFPYCGGFFGLFFETAITPKILLELINLRELVVLNISYKALQAEVLFTSGLAEYHINLGGKSKLLSKKEVAMLLETLNRQRFNLSDFYIKNGHFGDALASHINVRYFEFELVDSQLLQKVDGIYLHNLKNELKVLQTYLLHNVNLLIEFKVVDKSYLQ